MQVTLTSNRVEYTLLELQIFKAVQKEKDHISVEIQKHS